MLWGSGCRGEKLLPIDTRQDAGFLHKKENCCAEFAQQKKSIAAIGFNQFCPINGAILLAKFQGKIPHKAISSFIIGIFK